MRSIPWQAEHQFGVFTHAQAREHGWTDSALRHAARTDVLIRLRKGLYCEPPDSSLHPREQAAVLLGRRGVAAALAIPDGTVSHAAALAVHGLPLYGAGDLPCLTKPQDCRTLQADLHLHRKLLEPRLLDAAAEFSLTSVARSCIDVACELGLRAGVIAADNALHDGLTTYDDLFRARCSVKGDRGSPVAGRLLDAVDARAESPLESLSRVNMAGLVPPPLVQPLIFTVDGVFVGRVDFAWDPPGVVGEADGRAKYRMREDELDQEKSRQDRLTDTNAVMARWGWRAAQDPNRLADYLQSRFAVAWQRRAAGIRPNWILRPSDRSRVS
jgi:hypothetical protein